MQEKPLPSLMWMFEPSIRVTVTENEITIKNEQRFREATYVWHIENLKEIPEHVRNRHIALVELIERYPISDVLLEIRNHTIEENRLFSDEDYDRSRRTFVQSVIKHRSDFVSVKSILECETLMPGKVTPESLTFARNVAGSLRSVYLMPLFDRNAWPVYEPEEETILRQIKNATSKMEVLGQGFVEDAPTDQDEISHHDRSNIADLKLDQHECVTRLAVLSEIVISRMDLLKATQDFPRPVDEMKLLPRVDQRMMSILRVLKTAVTRLSKREILDNCKRQKFHGISSNSLSSEILPELKLRGLISSFNAKGHQSDSGRFYTITQTGAETVRQYEITF